MPKPTPLLSAEMDEMAKKSDVFVKKFEASVASTDGISFEYPFRNPIQPLSSKSRIYGPNGKFRSGDSNDVVSHAFQSGAATNRLTPTLCSAQVGLSGLLPIWMVLSYFLVDIRAPITLWVLVLTLEYVIPYITYGHEFSRKFSQWPRKNRWITERKNLIQPGIYYFDSDAKDGVGCRRYLEERNSRMQTSNKTGMAEEEGRACDSSKSSERKDISPEKEINKNPMKQLVEGWSDLPNYERDYSPWYFPIWKLLGCWTGDLLTLIPFVLYSRKEPTYTHRTWVKVQAYTEGEAAYYAIMRGKKEDGNAIGNGETTAGTNGKSNVIKEDVDDPSQTASVVENAQTPGVEEDAVGVDWAFPDDFNEETPLIVLLHGLNGGSGEKYVLSMAHRCLYNPGTDNNTGKRRRNYAVCVVMARGITGMPLHLESSFHGARNTDSYTALCKIGEIWGSFSKQRIFAIGFSMGAMTLNQILNRVGRNWYREQEAKQFSSNSYKICPIKICPIKAGISVSPSVNSCCQIEWNRSQDLWQPLIVSTCLQNLSRATFLKDRNLEMKEALKDPKKRAALQRLTRSRNLDFSDTDLERDYSEWGHPLRREFHPLDFTDVAASRDISGLDTRLIAPLHGFGCGKRGLSNYYRAQVIHAQNMQVCPLLILHALDDPLISQAGYLSHVCADEEPESDLELDPSLPDKETDAVRVASKIRYRKKRNRDGSLSTIRNADGSLFYDKTIPHKCITYLTQTGGHVGWPKSNPFDPKGWQFIQDVSLSFIDRCNAVLDS